jgi:Domain of unknown function (DUF3943)
MMRTMLITLLVLSLFVAGDALANKTAAPDTLQLPETKINNGLMALDLTLLTVGVWAPSRILGTDWAYIGFNTIEENLKTGFVWDHDDWAMNQWGHPLHGGQFFNAARTNGYGFWGSIPFTATGSMAWELFMEAEPPAINDLITTVAGGVYMGETAYRLSSMILDNTSYGSERTFREIGAFFVNPIRGFNRLVTGKTSQHGLNPEDWRPSYLGGHLSAGTNHVADGTDLGNSQNAYLLKGTFLYGDPFDDLADPDPFDYFSLRAALTLHGRFPLIHEATGTGLLYGRKFDHGDDNRSLFGVFQDYDYFDSRIYQFGGQSVGAGVFSRFNTDSPMQYLTGAQLNAVILGGSNVGFETAEGREYNYTTGAKFKIFGMLDHRKYGSFSLRYWVYWFHTISGVDGNEFVHWAQATLNPRIYKKWGLGLEYTYYLRNSYFHDYPETHLKNIELRTFVSYRF